MADPSVGPDGTGASPQEAPAADAKPSALAKLRKLFDSGQEPQEVVKTRRRFVAFFTVGFLTTNFLMFLRFFFPRTIFEPKTVFRIGTPGNFGIGFDLDGQANQLLLTEVPTNANSVYARVPFTVSLASAGTVFISADYDDGYVAWINGTEVYRSPERLPEGLVRPISRLRRGSAGCSPLGPKHSFVITRLAISGPNMSGLGGVPTQERPVGQWVEGEGFR